MSNLTDLLPAGGGGKNVDFVATGTLASGQAVALKTDGTVTAITGQVGTATTFASGANATLNTGMCFDPDNNKVIIAYRDVSSSPYYGYAVVGTVSGTSISFGTPVAFYSSASINGTVTAVYDTTANKVVLTFYPQAGGLYAIVGTVSGTSISFGSTANISAGPGYPSSVYDSSANKTLVSYSNSSGSSYPTVVAISVSGTTPSFGSPVVVVSAGVQDTSLSYDTTANKSSLVITNQSSSYFKAYVITISGTTPSAGSATDLGTFSNGVDGLSTAYNPDINRHIVVFRDRTSGAGQYFSNYIIFQISGTSITNNTAAAAFTNFNGGNPVVVYDTGANKVVVIYNSASYDVLAKIGTATTSSITFGDELIVGTGNQYAFGMVYDPTASKAVVGLYTGQAVVLDPAGVSSTDFLGITDAAISNAASGSVTIKGGIASNSSLLPSVFSGSAGSEVVFEAARADHSMSIFDSSNNKVVIIYADNGDSDNGKAIVGTVSGSSISYGTPVTFNAATTTRLSGTFDSNSNKIVIVYNDGGDSNKTKSIVGTVSGTSISFGSEATVTNNIASGTTTTFDSNLNKVVTFYKDDSNNEYGTAAVGTVSGTSISFGTPVVFESAQSVVTQSGSCFDTSNNKTVTVYRDVGNSSHGTAIVGTVSGTSISFGTVTAFHAASTEETLCAFDSGNNKVVVAYRDNAAPKALASRVGTVSGTGISFGTEATVQTISAYITHPAMTYSPDAGRVVIVYSNGDNSTYGTYAIGAVSGTDITYETPVVFAAAATEDCGIAYDTNLDKFVISFKDVDNSNHGTSVVLTVAGAVPALATGSTYYVQDDGTLSTTSSSVTAGKALSATSINLEYNS